MINSKKTLLGGQNGDDAPQLLEPDEYLNLMNARVTSASETGRGLRAENLPGTTTIVENVFPPYGVSFPIGSGIDEVRNRIIYFAQNTFDDHGIYCYEKSSGITYAVLYDSQVIGGLGFSKDSRIDRNVRVVGDLVYWTDDDNQPRRMNIEAGIKMNLDAYVTDVLPYSYPMNPEVLTIIRRPPLYPIAAQKFYQTSPSLSTNFVKDFSGEFCARYAYRDGEISVLSTYSTLMPYNTKEELYNRIDILFANNEYIDQDVQRVDLVVRYGNTNSFFVIYSWDKDNATQAAQIEAHNAGTPLSYSFYFDKIGESLDLAYVVKPFDSVPWQSKTIEIARNRCYLGNNWIGYNTPTTTSLTAAFVTTEEGAGAQGNMCKFEYYNFHTGRTYYTKYLVSIIGTAINDGFYTQPVDSNPNPGTLAWADLVFVGTEEIDVYNFYPGIPGLLEIFYPFSPGTAVEITGAPFSTSLVGASCFKTDASYQIGVVFYDFADRKSGVVTNDDNIYETPDRTYITIAFTTALEWSLSNANAINEIPEWATHYSIVINKCLRTRFFLQARVRNLTYATKDADGLYVFNTDTYAATLNGVAVDITLLNSQGMGYSFAQGDICKIYKYDGSTLTNVSISIVAQQGNWIVCDLIDIGTIGDTAGPFVDALFEIYTPYQQSTTEPYYEVAQTFVIQDAGTATREYSSLTGAIGGDVTMLMRNDGTDDYLTENMSPNDKYYTIWDTDAGRVNIVTSQGQSHETNTIAFSNVYIQGTNVNGLSSFEALNEKSLPNECGPLYKLQLTSKVSEQGNVMLGICVNETVSIYLGEVQVVGADTNAFLAQAVEVIGTINVLKGSYGTLNPESVIEFRGLVFWFDVLNGKVIQYSANGLQPISDYKQARFFQRYSAEYIQAHTLNLDNINGFHHITTCIDPFTNEFLITLPALIYENYADVLPSYSSVPSYATSIVNRFDIFDRLGKTMSFDILGNKWRQNYEYMPDWMDYLQTGVYGYKNDCTLYLHNSNTNAYNTWYGVEYPVRLCMSWNVKEAPSAIKDVFDTALESNAAPDFTVLYGTYPWVQLTDLESSDYDEPEGVFYARFFRDRLTPGALTADQNLYSGNVFKENCPKVMFEFQQYDGLFYVTFVNLGFQISKGTQSLIGR